MSSYQGIADRLVQDGYLLTALELHIELAERGKSLKSLKDYFESSANFEKFTRQTSSKKSPSPAGSISSITGSQVNYPHTHILFIFSPIMGGGKKNQPYKSTLII